jgi:two-component system KDP operon response regulator KdpE
MTRVLVFEGRDVSRASGLLSDESFTVVTAIETSEVIEVLETFEPNIILAEVPTPHSRVVQMCAAIRSVSMTPIIVLSGPCSERDAIAVFTAGADSVVIDPVGSHELVARVRALVRRTPPSTQEANEVIVVGPIVLDRGRRELTVNGERVAVPRREFDIAEFLMREAGRVVPRRLLVRELWGSMRDTKSLDVQVGRLRSRLAAAAGWPCIVTVRGVGFRFASDDEFVTSSGDAELDLVEVEAQRRT